MGIIFCLSFASFANAFGLEDAQKTKVIAEITTVITKNGTSDKFLKCVTTKDPRVYATITNKEKMSSIKNLPLKDIKQINKVVQACRVSK